MKTELIEHLNEIAKIMKMTKINDRQYKGEHGTLFRRTDFGYIPEFYFNRDLEGKEKIIHISKSYSLNLPSCIRNSEF